MRNVNIQSAGVVSSRFVSFRFISFRFVSSSRCYPPLLHHTSPHNSIAAHSSRHHHHHTLAYSLNHEPQITNPVSQIANHKLQIKNKHPIPNLTKAPSCPNPAHALLPSFSQLPPSFFQTTTPQTQPQIPHSHPTKVRELN